VSESHQCLWRDVAPSHDYLALHRHKLGEVVYDIRVNKLADSVKARCLDKTKVQSLARYTIQASVKAHDEFLRNGKDLDIA
jgi:hypothetical protein